MVFGQVLKWGALGLGLVITYLFARRSTDVGIGPAGQEVGVAIRSIGQGVGDVGGGLSSVFNAFIDPVFRIAEFFSPAFGGSQSNASDVIVTPGNRETSDLVYV